MVKDKDDLMSEIGDPRALVFREKELNTLYKILNKDYNELTITDIRDKDRLKLKLDKLINYINIKNNRAGAKITIEDRNIMFNEMYLMYKFQGEDVKFYRELVLGINICGTY